MLPTGSAPANRSYAHPRSRTSAGIVAAAPSRRALGARAGRRGRAGLWLRPRLPLLPDALLQRRPLATPHHLLHPGEGRTRSCAGRALASLDSSRSQCGDLAGRFSRRKAATCGSFRVHVRDAVTWQRHRAGCHEHWADQQGAVVFGGQGRQPGICTPQPC